jgi:hypothetical protein
VLLFDDIAAEYRDFAAYAEGDSPCFADWATQVADDADVLEWLAQLPPIKHQPNLVFAAARFQGVPAPGPYDGLRTALLSDSGPIRDTILTHATQTNEVGRIATLLPVLAAIAEQAQRPLALVEVGASAGLCLYPDQWTYRWRTDDGIVEAGAGPVLECRVKGAGRLPAGVPEVGWRGGIDLNPLDVTDEADMAWLTTLIWPEHEDRRERLVAAIAAAQAAPPHLVRGDLLAELPALVEEASRHGEVVVFHSAVIAYLEPDDRDRFETLIRRLVSEERCRWVSNEGKNVLPSITATGPAIPASKQTFVLGLDGQAVAHTHGHGRSLRWC